MKRFAIGLALTVAAGGMTGCGSTGTTSTPAAQTTAHQAAEDLASLQEGTQPEANDPVVSAIERATVALIPYCKTSPVEIDATANADLEDLKNHGITETAPHVLSELLTFYTHAD